jgi:ParB family chromosome partitioning protein
VCEAVRLGVYPTPTNAISVLFANATSAKRSKIGSFARLHRELGAVLRFPTAIPEHLGLALVRATDNNASFTVKLKATLRKSPPESPEGERVVLNRALRKETEVLKTKPSEIIPGVVLEVRKGRVLLSGRGVTEVLLRDLAAWLAGR